MRWLPAPEQRDRSLPTFTASADRAPHVQGAVIRLPASAVRADIRIQRIDSMLHSVILSLSVTTMMVCAADVRLVDESGSVSNAGLVQVSTEAGFGTICGANAAAADVALR